MMKQENNYTATMNTKKNDLQRNDPDNEAIHVSSDHTDIISENVEKIQNRFKKDWCTLTIWSLALNVILAIGLSIALCYLFPKLDKKNTYNKVDLANEGFKLNKRFHMKNYDYHEVSADAWVSWRNAKNDYLYENLDSKYDFWTDKLKTFRCLDGINGLKFVPILWYTSQWDETNESRLRRFLENYDYEKNGSLFLKPSHMTNSDGAGMTISNPGQINTFVRTLKERINCNINFDRFTTQKHLSNKIPMTQKDFKKYIDCQKQIDYDCWKNDYRHVRAIPGIMIQQEFDLNKYPEIKFNVVFGKVINFKIDAKNRMAVSQTDGSLSCEEDGSYGCVKIWDLMNWNEIIPKIQGFANKIHIEYIRVDIFPISKTDFFINEIEVLSSAKVRGSENIAHKGVVDILKQKNKEIMNASDETEFFLPNENDFDFICDIENFPYSNFE